ncbi:MAG: SDR family oxidoreductase [Acidobacteriota bacterium]|nr:SDR family oxidoreductase [Acidobacteriota bacterium]
MDLGVADRRYLIVGGTAGMGWAAAEVLATEGARVALVGRNRDRAAEAAGRLPGEKAVAVIGDVSRPGGAEAAVADAVAHLGGLDGIAVTTGTGMSAHTSLEAATDDVWAAAFDDVLMGTVRSVKAALPHLVESGGGTVVTTAAYSIHAYHPARLPYVVMKSGVAAFTKTVAKEFGPKGVRANCVCPGAIETEALSGLRRELAGARGVSPEGLLEQVMVEEWHMDVALGRPGQPGEVGDLFAFLLSSRAGYLTGAVVNIDGGTDF